MSIPRKFLKVSIEFLEIIAYKFIQFCDKSTVYVLWLMKQTKNLKLDKENMKTTTEDHTRLKLYAYQLTNIQSKI